MKSYNIKYCSFLICNKTSVLRIIIRLSDLTFFIRFIWSEVIQPFPSLFLLLGFYCKKVYCEQKGMPFILQQFSYYELFCWLKWVLELYIECILCCICCLCCNDLFVPLNLLQRNAKSIAENVFNECIWPVNIERQFKWYISRWILIDKIIRNLTERNQGYAIPKD